MTDVTSIGASGNTFNPCLLILRSKGYELLAEASGERLLWKARKSGLAFTGFSPPELLGIVVLWETYGHDWRRQRPDVVREITDRIAERPPAPI